MERYHADSEYAILVFHDRYDIPAKASDKERLGESEEMFEYLICVICPLSGEYEPGEPECGFLFPAFTDRCGCSGFCTGWTLPESSQNQYHRTSGNPLLIPFANRIWCRSMIPLWKVAAQDDRYKSHILTNFSSNILRTSFICSL